MTLNKENLKTWIAALRSGKYKQAKKKLYDGEGYCCLGVACLLAGLTLFGESTYYYFGNDMEISSVVLPKAAQNWLGTNYCSVAVTIDGTKHDVTHLNDNGATFEEIADALENTYLEE